MTASNKDAASRSGSTRAWRRAFPWWAKVASKVVLSRMPVSGATWQKLRLFSPGFMLDADYAVGVFRRHFESVGSPGMGFVYVELGPGDSVATAAVAWAHGAARGWLVDAGAYANRDIAAYGPLFERLVARRDELGLLRDPAQLVGLTSFAQLLAITNATYREDGLAGLRAVPTESADFVMSHATLEHVPRQEFGATQIELHRILKAGGRASHQVDFKDHLGGSLNNLRFEDSAWEKPWFARRSGFYTNRLRLSEVESAMADAGFAVRVLETRRWSSLPLRRDQLASQFRALSDEDLLTSSATLIAGKHG